MFRHGSRYWYMYRSGLKSDVRGSIRDRLIFKSGRLEYYALAIALAMPLALDAIRTDGTLFAALDATLAAREASGLSTLSGQFGLQSSFSGRCIRSLLLDDLTVVMSGFVFELH